MSTLHKLERADIQPLGTVSATLLNKVRENQEALRTLAFGTRAPAGASPPHDHGENGGMHIAGRPVLSLNLGPHFNPLSGGAGIEPLVGVPLIRPQPQVSFATDAKQLVVAPVFLPGGVAGVTVRLVLEIGSSEALLLSVSLRPFRGVNYQFGEAPGEVSVDFTDATPSTPYAAYASDLTDLTSLGDPAFDRECEIVVWQRYDATVAAVTNRLVNVALTATGTPVTRGAGPGDHPLATITVADIKEKAPLTSDLSSRLRTRVNQEIGASIGLAPGLQADGRSPDRRRPYTQEITGAHSHEGILCPVDESSTEFEARGAIIREQYAVSTYLGSYGQGANDRADLTPVTGTGFDIGTPGVDQMTTSARISVPAGLGALLVRFCGRSRLDDINPALEVGVRVRDFAGTDYAVGVSSGPYVATEQDADSFWICGVDAEENDRFQPTKARRRAGKGQWTDDALLPGHLIPPGIYQTISQTTVERPQRVSQLVRVELTYPPLRPADAGRKTRDMVISLRWILYPDADIATESSLFDLLWWHCFPAPGY